MTQVLLDYMVSLKKEPPIRPGTQDPYVPSHEKESAPKPIGVPVD